MKRFVSEFLALVLASTLLVNVFGAQTAFAQGSWTNPGSSERVYYWDNPLIARVWGRKLPSGNVELGLRVNGKDLDPELPNRFLLSDGSELGKWHYSTRIIVGTDDGATFLEVGARWLSSGNVELGLLLEGNKVVLPLHRYYQYDVAITGDPPILSSPISLEDYISPCYYGAIRYDDNNPGLLRDCEALLEAKDKLIGNGFSEALDWEGSQPIIKWYGIETALVNIDGRAQRRVIRVDGSTPAGNPDSSVLRGHIPPELGKLTALTELDLSMNKLRGSIPSELSRLENLKELYLSDNELTGPLPAWLERLQKLQTVYLFNNDFSGTIPARWVFLGTRKSQNTVPERYIMLSIGGQNPNQDRHYSNQDNHQLSGCVPSILDQYWITIEFGHLEWCPP